MSTWLNTYLLTKWIFKQDIIRNFWILSKLIALKGTIFKCMHSFLKHVIIYLYSDMPFAQRVHIPNKKKTRNTIKESWHFSRFEQVASVVHPFSNCPNHRNFDCLAYSAELHSAPALCCCVTSLSLTILSKGILLQCVPEAAFRRHSPAGSSQSGLQVFRWISEHSNWVKKDKKEN